MTEHEKNKIAGELIKKTFQALLKVFTVPIPIIIALGLALIFHQSEIDFFSFKFDPKASVIVLLSLLSGLYLYCARCFRMLVLLLKQTGDKEKYLYILQQDSAVLNPYLKSDGKFSQIFDYSGIFGLSTFFSIAYSIIGRIVNPENRRTVLHPIQNMKSGWGAIVNNLDLFTLTLLLSVSFCVFVAYLVQSWWLINPSDYKWRILTFFITIILLILIDFLILPS